MYIDLKVITFLVGIVFGICIHLPIQWFIKRRRNNKSIRHTDNRSDYLPHESSGIINNNPKKTKLIEDGTINMNSLIRDCLEFHLENDNLSQILNASACESIKCSIKAIAEHVKVRFDGYVRSNFYMYDISFLYELSDDEIDNNIDIYVADYIGKRKKVQEKILIALNNEIGVEVDPRLKDKTFTNIKPSDEVDVFKASEFYSGSFDTDVRF